MEETTRLVLDRLLEHLDGEVSEDPKLIGRALYDQNLAIIHHFYGAAEGRGQFLRKIAIKVIFGFFYFGIFLI